MMRLEEKILPLQAAKDFYATAQKKIPLIGRLFIPQ
jgi:hypothetical protein